MNTIVKEYDQRHGGAWDRGSADSYYGRAFKPHYFAGATYSSDKIEVVDPSSPEWEAYKAGYDWNERFGDKKSWD
jgi:hypothetical protein